MRMLAGFGPGEHRGEAGIRGVKYAAPFVPGFALERRGEAPPHLRPARAIVLRRQLAELQASAELGEELVFDGADRDELAVGGLVDVVPGRTAVEDVGAALLGPA